MLVKPEKYETLEPGMLLLFRTKDGDERGRLLYAFTHKNYILDKDGNVTSKFWLMGWRTGYEPVPSRLTSDGRKVYSVHLEAGRFTIHTVKNNE